MRPDPAALKIVSITRAKAKMHEFQVPEEHHIQIPQNPSILFSFAIAILGDIAARVADEFVPADPLSEITLGVPEYWDDWDFEVEKQLGFAATFFDAYINSRLDADLDEDFSVLCAAAYYIAGSVGSATVVLRHTAAPSIDRDGGLLALVYAIISNDFGAIDGANVVTNEVLTALRRFFALEAGAVDVADACENIREQVYDCGTPRELLLADLVSAVCALKVRAASRSLLPKASDLDLEDWWIPLTKPGFPRELWPAQKRICEAGLLIGESAVIQMPTSAGKTRATELIIRSAFLSGRTRLTVIVAPFRSLCHDIRSDLAAAFAEEEVEVTEASESYQVDITFDDEVPTSTVLIVTPEKLLYLLRLDPSISEMIGLIIYDEGHQFQGMTRGPTYELLLTTLKMSLKPEAQTVLISAVIGNADQIAEWLIGKANVVRGEGLLPTTKSIAFASWEHPLGQLAYVSPTDPEELEFFVPRLLSRTMLPKFGRETADRFFPEEEGPDVGLYLGLHLVRQGSVAVFCGRKDTASNLAGRAAKLFFERGLDLPNPLDVSSHAELERMRALTAANLGSDADATQAASLGILVHHGDTPHGLRVCIEHAMKESLAKFVVCTSTLAQGVNFPIKYLIVTATQQGKERILVRDFHNLIGRAGRAGMHTEGSVIFSAPKIYDERNNFRFRYRWLSAKELLDPDNAEPCESGLLSIFDDYQQRIPPINLPMRPTWLDLTFATPASIAEIVAEALTIEDRISERDFTEFLNDRARAVQNVAAYLANHMAFDAEDAVSGVEELAHQTLAYQMADEETRNRLVEVFKQIALALKDHADQDLRGLIRRSPLAPSQIAALSTWLKANESELEAAAVDGRLLEAVAPTVLSLTTSKTIKNIANPDAAMAAFGSWCRGASFEEIFAELQGMKVKFGHFHLKIDHVVSLCENGFGYDAAMILASLADLAADLEGLLPTALAALQRSAKCGLASMASISFYEAGFVDRVVAQDLGGRFPATGRRDVREFCQVATAEIEELLKPYPSYFQTIVTELQR